MDNDVLYIASVSQHISSFVTAGNIKAGDVREGVVESVSIQCHWSVSIVVLISSTKSLQSLFHEFLAWITQLNLQ